MLSVSQDFIDNAKAYGRNIKAFVVMHFLKKMALPTAIASSTYDLSTAPKMACNGRFQPEEHLYTGLIDDRFEDEQKGWWSANVSNSTSVINESITVTYPELISSKNFWVVADDSSYPADFVIEYFNGSSWVALFTIANNTKSIWSGIKTSNSSFTQLRLRVTKMNGPNKRLIIKQFGAINTVVFEDSYLIDINLLEETKASTGSPIGGVSSNECTISLGNSNYWFSQNNQDSPFCGLLKPNIKFEPFMGIETAPDSFECIPLGVFQSEDWQGAPGSIEVALTGYDRLYSLGDIDVPRIMPKKDTTVSELLSLLFDALSIPSLEYSIDPALNSVVPYGWIPNGSVMQSLQSLCIPGNCNIVTNRDNIITVKANVISGSAVDDISDDSQIIFADNPTKFLDIYSEVKVEYQQPTVRDSESVLNANKIEAPLGISVIKDLKFNDGPIAIIDYIRINGPDGIVVKSINYGAWDIDIEIDNTGSSATKIDIIVFGRKIDTISRTYQISNNQAISEWGKKTYTIKNPLIQTEDVAASYGLKVLDLLSNPSNTVQVNLRGNPAYEVNDIIQISDAADRVFDMKIVITRMQLIYDGGLESKIVGRKI